jgi:lambda repressor-like predicted transcriptional regulator
MIDPKALEAAAATLANELCGCATREQHKRDIAAVLAYRAAAVADATAPLKAEIARLREALTKSVAAYEKILAARAALGGESHD